MPELAEVEHSRRQWDPGIGQIVLSVRLARPEIRIFRDTDTAAIQSLLPGKKAARLPSQRQANAFPVFR